MPLSEWCASFTATRFLVCARQSTSRCATDQFWVFPLGIASPDDRSDCRPCADSHARATPYVRNMDCRSESPIVLLAASGMPNREIAAELAKSVWHPAVDDPCRARKVKPNDGTTDRRPTVWSQHRAEAQELRFAGFSSGRFAIGRRPVRGFTGGVEPGRWS